jgi:hypothetical protein
MQKLPIAAIINFCSNESRFIGPCIEQALLFAKQVVIPVCDHFFDGTVENRELLEKIYRAYPDCLFVEYPFIPAEIPRRIFKDISPAHFWHSCSRLIGSSFLHKSIEEVLFLDADEIPDGARFSEWLEASDYHHHSVMKMSNYWYFREPSQQALSWEDSIVMVQARAITPELILHQEERNAIYDLLPGPKRRNVTACDGKPMFHHYSWVRTKEEMLKKVQSWGLKVDRDWAQLVHKEFSTPFTGTDFVYGYKYKSVTPSFNIQMDQVSIRPVNKDPNVVRLTQKDLCDLLKFKKSIVFEWLSGLLK